MTELPALSLITEEEKTAFCTLRSASCFFTGHRELLPEHRRQLSELLSAEVESLIYQGFSIFWSGAARGFDLMAAAAVLQQKRNHSEIRLCLAIPCPEQSARWPSEEKELYKTVLSMGEPYLLSPRYDRGCMQRRNRFLVDHAVTGVAYYEKAKSCSGTAQTVRYAEKNGIPVINLVELMLR